MKKSILVKIIKEALNEKYYETLKPVKGYTDAEDIIGNYVWVHTNRTHRNEGKNGMVGIYKPNPKGNRVGSPIGYTNEIRLTSPIHFQTSEKGAERIQKSKEDQGGAGKRALIAGMSGVVIPTKSGDISGMVKVQFNPFESTAWFYIVGDSEKKEVISGSEVYFNATETGDWETYVKTPIFKETSKEEDNTEEDNTEEV